MKPTTTFKWRFSRSSPEVTITGRRSDHSPDRFLLSSDTGVFGPHEGIIKRAIIIFHEMPHMYRGHWYFERLQRRDVIDLRDFEMVDRVVEVGSNGFYEPSNEVTARHVANALELEKLVQQMCARSHDEATIEIPVRNLQVKLAHYESFSKARQDMVKAATALAQAVQKVKARR